MEELVKKQKWEKQVEENAERAKFKAQEVSNVPLTDKKEAW